MFAWLIVVVMFICVAMLWNEGMWANALNLVNVTLAAALATNLYEPAADYLEKQMASFTYLLDFLCLWAIFALVYSVLRACTDGISNHAVRFRLPIERGGRIVFALATAWVLACFITTSIHTAPLSVSPFRGSFAKEPLSNDFFGLAPDRMWLGFMHSRSSGALAKSTPRVFDPDGDFILKYGARRFELAEHNKKEGAIRVKKK